MAHGIVRQPLAVTALLHVPQGRSCQLLVTDWQSISLLPVAAQQFKAIYLPDPVSSAGCAWWSHRKPGVHLPQGSAAAVTILQALQGREPAGRMFTGAGIAAASAAEAVHERSGTC